MLSAQGVEAKPFNSEAMKDPGFKVLHVPDIDFRTHCSTFKACLLDIRTWSQSHKDHLPIIITINPKSDGTWEAWFCTRSYLSIKLYWTTLG